MVGEMIKRGKESVGASRSIWEERISMQESKRELATHMWECERQAKERVRLAINGGGGGKRRV